LNGAIAEGNHLNFSFWLLQRPHVTMSKTARA
jgi:hypothetical protein